MNAKDWIKELQSNPNWAMTEIDWEAVDEIERKLRAFEIVKEKKANAWILAICDDVGAYNASIPNDMMKKLTPEEFDLLKEELP